MASGCTLGLMKGSRLYGTWYFVSPEVSSLRAGSVASTAVLICSFPARAVSLFSCGRGVCPSVRLLFSLMVFEVYRYQRGVTLVQIRCVIPDRGAAVAVPRPPPW